MNTSRKGNSFERSVAEEMIGMGFVVASRRHIGGAGDLLGVHPDGRIWLVEVKDRKNPYEGFRREDRRAMSETPLPKNSFKFLACRNGKTTRWVGEAEWPPH